MVWIGLLLAACGGPTPLTFPLASTRTVSAGMTHIGIQPGLPPYVQVDASGKNVTGFDIELMNAIAAKAGLQVQFVGVAKNELLNAVLNCQLDAGISAISMTDALKQQLTFSEPYWATGQALVVKKGNITISGTEQLPGMTVGAQTASPAAVEIQNIPNTQLITYPSIDVAFRDLIIGNIDAVVASRPRAASYASIASNNLKIVGGEVGTESYGIAVCNQDPTLLEKINAGLAAVKADGTLDKLAGKWDLPH